MEKLVYLLWAPEGRDRDDFRDLLLRECGPALLERGARGLTINVDDSDADVPPPVPTPAGEVPLSAEVALWLDCHDRRGPHEEVLARSGARCAGYLVSEALYTEYGGNPHGRPRDWPDGQRSPGLLTVTLLERPARMPRAEWIAHWHGVQSPVSEELQPRIRYVRNEVVRPLTEGAPPFEGIVDEAWASARHVTDPMLFYRAEGSPERLRQNIRRMLESVTGFLELERIRCNTMSEYILAS
jgi:hypothetical protein